MSISNKIRCRTKLLDENYMKYTIDSVRLQSIKSFQTSILDHSGFISFSQRQKIIFPLDQATIETENVVNAIWMTDAVYFLGNWFDSPYLCSMKTHMWRSFFLVSIFFLEFLCLHKKSNHYCIDKIKYIY